MLYAEFTDQLAEPFRRHYIKNKEEA